MINLTGIKPTQLLEEAVGDLTGNQHMLNEQE